MKLPAQQKADQTVYPTETSDLWTYHLPNCESGVDWSKNSGNGHYGGIQFTQQSWEAMGGKGNPADAPAEEQIMRGQMLVRVQGWAAAFPGCSLKLGLR